MRDGKSAGRAPRRAADAVMRHGRAAVRRGKVPMWLHALLLALAPVLVFGFYSVVDDAVERAAARRATPPAARASVVPLKPVVWECTAAQRGAGVHNACRPVPAVDLRSDNGRVPTAKS